MRSQSVFEILSDEFGHARANAACEGIRAGELKVHRGVDWIFTTEKDSDALYVANAVGDFSKVYGRIVTEARKNGFRNIHFHTARTDAFIRRIRIAVKDSVSVSAVNRGKCQDYVKLRIN